MVTNGKLLHCNFTFLHESTLACACIELLFPIHLNQYIISMDQSIRFNFRQHIPFEYSHILEHSSNLIIKLKKSKIIISNLMRLFIWIHFSSPKQLLNQRYVTMYTVIWWWSHKMLFHVECFRCRVYCKQISVHWIHFLLQENNKHSINDSQIAILEKWTVLALREPGFIL